MPAVAVAQQDEEIVRLRAGDSQLVTDGSRYRRLDFPMPGNGGTSTVGGIAVNGVIAAFPVQFASLIVQMPNQIAAFHATGTSTVSPSQMAFPGASFLALAR
jgi:hypothetical protein